MAMTVLPFCLLTFLPLSLSAQNPSWVKRNSQAVFTLKTFGADGSLMTSTNGFFVSESGEAVSSFAPFKGAQRAVVIDAQGKEWPVECLIGANDMYDVAKFKVSVKKPTALPVAAATAGQGATVWLLPYSAKKVPACKNGTISGAETFQDSYAYYTIDMQPDEQQTGSPILNDNGEAIGILHPAADAKATQSFAVSAPFAANMQMTGLGMNSPVMRSTGVEKALPDDYDQALLALFVATSGMDSTQYANYLERFIQKFPNSADGYIYRARNLASAGKYTEAEGDMQHALKVADKKDDVHYQYANLIYQYQLLQTDHPYEPWTLDKALAESHAAYSVSPQPVYQQQQAQILYAQKQYEEAFQLYQQLAQGSLRSADIFFAAAQCKLQQQDQEAALAQLDSAVNQYSKPYLKAAAPYLLARGQLRDQMGKYRLAVNDYNEYEQLMKTQLGHGFYYLREQAEFAGHLYQQAINDIKKAIELNPQETLYYAEKANIEVRVGLHDDAIATAQECIRLDPQLSDGYLFLGIAQCLKGQKAEGLQNLTKAKELGHDQAQTLIDKYAK